MIPYDYLDSASFYGSLWSPYNKPKWFWPQARSPCYHHCCRASSWPNSDPSIPCGKLPRTHLLNSIETQVTCETNLIHMGYETGVHPQAPWKKGKLMINHQDLGPCFVVATNPPAGQVSFIQNKPRTTPQKKNLKKYTRTTNQVHHYHHYGISMYISFLAAPRCHCPRDSPPNPLAAKIARLVRHPKNLLGGSQQLVNWNT